MDNKKNKFKAGDVVSLKSNPEHFMTVEQYQSETVVMCIWFDRDNQNFKEQVLFQDLLEEVNPNLFKERTSKLIYS